MKDIAIYGAGGFGKEVACLINRINEKEKTWNLIGFFDDNPEKKGKMVSHFAPCLGGLKELNDYNEPIAVAMSMGNSNVIQRIVPQIENANVWFPNLIHPNFTVSDPKTLKMGRGNIIQGGCTVTCDVTIGDFNVLNGAICFGHDVSVGSYNTFMPAVRISGEVRIGNGNFFGVGSIVLQQLKIGDGVRLGAGSVLMTKPKNGNLYIGVPAKKAEF
ncbi:MAG: NeuD/PglB/VioB family sugar acetyltransferase [Prevotella sp.]|nr:NeuD/PglB/VioB family sugar acetyltransferase [Prevotella sp.]